MAQTKIYRLFLLVSLEDSNSHLEVSSEKQDAVHTGQRALRPLSDTHIPLE